MPKLDFRAEVRAKVKVGKVTVQCYCPTDLGFFAAAQHRQGVSGGCLARTALTGRMVSAGLGVGQVIIRGLP